MVAVNRHASAQGPEQIAVHAIPGIYQLDQHARPSIIVIHLTVAVNKTVITMVQHYLTVLAMMDTQHLALNALRLVIVALITGDARIIAFTMAQVCFIVHVILDTTPMSIIVLPLITAQ